MKLDYNKIQSIVIDSLAMGCIGLFLGRTLKQNCSPILNNINVAKICGIFYAILPVMDTAIKYLDYHYPYTGDISPSNDSLE